MNDDLRPEYNLRSLTVRRLGSERKQFGHTVRLEPDVAEAFPDSASENEALRTLIRTSEQ
ncbi:MAG: hypothetical protein AAF728_18475 [Cyanobacteria bacterium P01_D01_bin.128]